MAHRDDTRMTRQVISRIAGALLLAGAALSPGCKDDLPLTPHQPIVSGFGLSVGDPCFIRGDETDSAFAGYAVSSNIITSKLSLCSPGVCLINHFQGRVSCPLGQSAPALCAGATDTSYDGGLACVPAPTGPYCDSLATDGGASRCPSGHCVAGRDTCACTTDAQCPGGSTCDLQEHQCTHFVCHDPSACQHEGASDAENEGKSCCDVRTSAPVSVAVCGQCERGSGRSAEEAAYCSCRCGLADGETAYGSAFCACPEGFECTQIHPDDGLGMPGPPAKYCIKQGTAYTDPGQCGSVSGHFSPSQCDGTPAD